MSKKLEELLKSNSGIMLDLGCGRAKRDGWVGMDKRALKEVDIVHNLEDVPWPLPSDCCITILASHIIEHLDPRNLFDVMAEIHRVGRHGCQVQISTPYAGSHGAYQDPSHVRPGFNETYTLYFDPRPLNGKPNILYSIYEPPPFFTERVNWAVNGNMEILFRVIKNPVDIKKALKNKKREVTIVGS